MPPKRKRKTRDQIRIHDIIEDHTEPEPPIQRRSKTTKISTVAPVRRSSRFLRGTTKSSLQSPPGSSASGSPITAEFDFQLHGPDSDPAFATYDQQNVNLNPLLPEVPSGTLGSGSGSKIENDSQRPISPPDLSRPASPEIVFPSIGAHKTTQPGNFSRSDITTNTTNPETAPPAMVQIPPPPRDRVPRNPPTVSGTCGDPYSSTIDGSESYITRLGSRHFGDYMSSDWRQSFPQTHRESALRSTISHQKPSSDNKTREPAGGVSYVDISPSGVLSISSMAPLMDRDSPHSPPQLSPPPQAPPAPAERLAQAREAIAPFMREKSLLSPQDISAGRIGMPAPATVRRVTTGQKNTYPIVVMEHRVGFPRNPSSLCPLPTKLPKVPPRERVITVEKSLHRQMLIIRTESNPKMKQARMTVSHIITRQREETAKRINAQVLPQLSSLLEGNPPTISRDISHIGGLPVREHPLATLARLNVPRVSDPPPVSEHPFVASARRGSVGLSGPFPSPVPLGSTRRGSMSLSIPAPTQAAEHPGVVSARRSSISLNKPVPTPVAEHPLVASARRAASISLGIGEASAYSFFGIGGSALDLGLGDNRSFTGDRNKSVTGGRIDTREISGMGEESSPWLSDYGWLSSSTNSPRRSAQSELCYRPPGDYRWVDENAIASSDGDSEGKRCIRNVLLYDFMSKRKSYRRTASKYLKLAFIQNHVVMRHVDLYKRSRNRPPRRAASAISSTAGSTASSIALISSARRPFFISEPPMRGYEPVRTPISYPQHAAHRVR